MTSTGTTSPPLLNLDPKRLTVPVVLVAGLMTAAFMLGGEWKQHRTEQIDNTAELVALNARVDRVVLAAEATTASLRIFAGLHGIEIPEVEKGKGN